MEDNGLTRGDMPQGFGMLLAENDEALLKFRGFTPEQQRSVIAGARRCTTQSQMERYIQSIANIR